MKKAIFIFIGIVSTVFAQNGTSNQTLFTIAGNKVSVADFVRVYTKNNINNQADFSKQSLEEYLSLYKNFRLKVKEAESLGMDTVATFKNELASYRRQLVSSYMSDREATEKLVKEAYDRMKEEVNVKHILIFWPNKSPNQTDSLVVLNEIKKIKEAAENSSFETQMAKYNKNNKSKYPNNQPKYESGPLGYVSALQTVYPFENAMYNTPVGTISKPVATRFGYHLVYVLDKRATRGKMETAHLLVKSKSNDSPENQKNAAEKANQIYNEITSKQISFEDAVKKYSEDKRTKFQKGKLPLLSSAQMLEPFADAAFALQNNEDITKPIKTKIGWHIIKRIRKEDLPSFKETKASLENKVKKDTRSNVANDKMIADSKAKFGYIENSYTLNELINALKNNNFNTNNLLVQKNNLYDKTMFSIGNEKVSQYDFLNYLGRRPVNIDAKNYEDYYRNNYNTFKNEKIKTYRKNHLEDIVDEFKYLMQEYHDGILLFELTNEQVWNKAVEDTLGLKNYFEENRNRYVWKDRMAYTTFTAKDEKSATKLKKFLLKGKNNDFIVKKLNRKEETVTIEPKLVEIDSDDMAKTLKTEKGYLSEEKNLDGSVKVFFVTDLVKPEKKKLSETRGYVISDYQDFLEKKWLSSLRKKYPININNEAFQSLIK